jgi:uncharacterized membrane protein YkoI
MRLISEYGSKTRTITLSLLAALTPGWLGLSGCAIKSAGQPPAETSTVSPAPERVWENFHAKNFTRPTIIDNEWLPLKPGRQWVFEGTTTEAGKALAHRIELTVTDLTKEIAGVRTAVTFEADYTEGELVEKEISFYAQDNDGNVWHLGEYPEEYEDGNFIKAPTWLTGLEDAKPGIIMKAKPQLGTPSYFQGWGPKVGWTDYGQVDRMGEKTCVRAGCYEDVLVIAESALDEVNASQIKYYASDVGNVRVGWKGGDASKEELELVKFAQLDSQALTKIRTKALELEAHGYEVSPTVYALTIPIPGGGAQIPPPALKTAASEARNISEDQAKEIAMKAVPGDVTDVSIEKKLGANRYIVEVIAKENRTETDVVIDMDTGKILAIEK